jgi:hypothetical protein
MQSVLMRAGAAEPRVGAWIASSSVIRWLAAEPDGSALFACNLQFLAVVVMSPMGRLGCKSRLHQCSKIPSATGADFI